MLPTVTGPVRLNDLPTLLGPYARTAPIFVYMMSCGNLKATRLRLGADDDEDLMLVLAPRGLFPLAEASASMTVFSPPQAPLL